MGQRAGDQPDHCSCPLSNNGKMALRGTIPDPKKAGEQSGSKASTGRGWGTGGPRGGNLGTVARARCGLLRFRNEPVARRAWGWEARVA